MKQYKCHKIVHAEPMVAMEFYGTSIGEHKMSDDDVSLMAKGYHVIYSKGTPDEYHSWSPKKPFDEGYSEWNNFDFDEPDVCETCSS